jgi:4-amino-4-deoxy-L-arabinose transferase-like glycosyltransferase
MALPPVQHRAASGARQWSRAWLIAAAVVLPIVLIYVAYLDRSPVYLSHDEVVFGSHGHAIATTGRDLNGRLFPLFFHVRAGYWATPVTIYWMALVQQVLPLSEIAIRLATAIVGLASLVLMYFLARRVFQRRWLAVTAVVLLASSPAYFIHSRIAVDHIYPVPFMLGWLWCLKLAIERYRARLLLIGGLLMGIGFYSYLAAVVLMPLYLAITCIAISVQYKRFRRAAPAVLGFVLPVLLLVPWLAAHPGQYADQIRMYSIYDSARLNAVGGAFELLRWDALLKRWDIYYNFFNPSFLFFSGGSSLLNATTRAGVFLLPLAILLPLGIFRIVSDRRTVFNIVVLAALACAPLPSVLVADAAVNRGLVMLPCAALVATFGMELLISQEKLPARALAVCLLAAVPLQFGYFLNDYHRGYRVRSAFWFEGNIRGALETILGRADARPVPHVYLSTDIDWLDWYWRFYVNKHRRPELLDRAVYFDPKTTDVSEIPAGSIVLAKYDTARSPDVDRNAARSAVVRIAEPEGNRTMFEVFTR